PLQLQAVVDGMLGDLKVQHRADQASSEYRITERHQPEYGSGRGQRGHRRCMSARTAATMRERCPGQTVPPDRVYGADTRSASRRMWPDCEFETHHRRTPHHLL